MLQVPGNHERAFFFVVTRDVNLVMQGALSIISKGGKNFPLKFEPSHVHITPCSHWFRTFIPVYVDFGI